ncbi:MAG TPA: PilZ domain-containing protein [Gammaproteobacteria bacterium]|nr:PilZ domain-containing protein [Gammaproteobacteria bacterium]
MSKRPNLNLVHEAEAQRQYARVKIPATLKVNFPEAEARLYRPADISAGGFCVLAVDSEFAQGRIYQGQIVFSVDGFKFLLDARFQARSVNPVSKRVGCEFQEMDPKQMAALRYLITSFLGGELVSAGDMLNTLARQNFTKSRQQLDAERASGKTGRFRALLLSLVVFLCGLAAAGYVGSQLYGILFVTASQTASLTTPRHEIVMPRAGDFSSLVEAGTRVEKGQPIANFRAPVIEYMDRNLGAVMSGQQIQALASQFTSGTLTSPCDCVVTELTVGDKQYVSRGTKVFELAEDGGEPFVLAYFEFGAADHLRPGDAVKVEVMGESRSLAGRIGSIRVADPEVKGAERVEVTVSLDEPMTGEYIDRPLRVTKSRLTLPRFASNNVAVSDT